MRRKPSRRNHVGALYLVRDGFNYHEQIVDLSVARRSRWCTDDPSDLAKPHGRCKFFRGAVPVATQDPWPHEPG